jgi:glycosyltransferase involved in cell wall biosynthesis
VSAFEITVLGVYALVLLVWAARHHLVTRTRRELTVLTARHPAYQGQSPPLVSVLIPAKDEAASIGDCIRSVLAQSYQPLEVIVIDDRSQDDTADIVRRIAAHDPRVRLLSTSGLPAGWTGKTNALATGAREARGTWLLFIDSDTRHDPSNLTILMEYARREQSDLVSILPRMRHGSFWERVCQPLAGMIVMLNFPVGRINDDAEIDTAFANGQYILMRRAAYEAVGGHAAVRDKFVEDIQLARVTKAHHYRIRLAIAPELSSTRMYTSLGDLVRGWSRILYAAYDHSTAHLAAVLAGLVVFSLSAYAVLAGTIAAWFIDHGHPSRYIATLFAMCLAHLALQTSVMVRVYNLAANQRRYVFFYSVAAGVMFLVLASALRKCFTHRIVWRGTCYERLEEPLPITIPLRSAARAASEPPLKQSA